MTNTVKVLWACGTGENATARLQWARAVTSNTIVKVEMYTAHEGDLGLDSLADKARDVTLVVADFSSDDGPLSAEAVAAATLGRFCMGKPTYLVVTDGTALPFDWRRLSILNIPSGIGGCRPLQDWFHTTVTRLTHPSGAALGNRIETDPPQVFLAMPFQGYIPKSPPPNNGFDFTKIRDELWKAIDGIDTQPRPALSIVGEGRHGDDIVDDIQKLLAQAAVVVADFSPDDQSKTAPNPNVITEATIARIALRHRSTLLLMAQRDTVIPATWGTFRTIFYDGGTMTCPTASNRPLYEVMRDALNSVLQQAHEDKAPEPILSTEPVAEVSEERLSAINAPQHHMTSLDEVVSSVQITKRPFYRGANLEYHFLKESNVASVYAQHLSTANDNALLERLLSGASAPEYDEDKRIRYLLLAIEHAKHDRIQRDPALLSMPWDPNSYILQKLLTDHLITSPNRYDILEYLSAGAIATAYSDIHILIVNRLTSFPNKEDVLEPLLEIAKAKMETHPHTPSKALEYVSAIHDDRVYTVACDLLYANSGWTVSAAARILTNYPEKAEASSQLLIDAIPNALALNVRTQEGLNAILQTLRSLDPDRFNSAAVEQLLMDAIPKEGKGIDTVLRTLWSLNRDRFNSAVERLVRNATANSIGTVLRTLWSLDPDRFISTVEHYGTASWGDEYFSVLVQIGSKLSKEQLKSIRRSIKAAVSSDKASEMRKKQLKALSAQSRSFFPAGS